MNFFFIVILADIAKVATFLSFWFCDNVVSYFLLDDVSLFIGSFITYIHSGDVDGFGSP